MTKTDRETVEALIGFMLRGGYEVQTGAGTNAPSVVWADADYEVGDGSCGLHETQKPANEPAIPYVRIDTLRALSAENERLREEVEKLQGLGPVISHHLNIIEEETKPHVAMNGVARNNIRYSASRIRDALKDTTQ